jgi:hypothetical protein
MRKVFLRAVLLGALVALALAVAKLAWAEKTVMICTPATESSPLRIETDTERKTILIEDVARSTTDLYPLNAASADWLDALQMQLHLEDKYRCRRAP